MSILHSNTGERRACSSGLIRNQQLVPNNTSRTGQKELTKVLTRAILGAFFWFSFMFPTNAQIATTYSSSSTFTVPVGVTELAVECWGGGGRGASRTSNGRGGGGGGGAYARSTIPVVPGNTYTVTVGGGSTGTGAGGDSWFSTSDHSRQRRLFSR
ncbi:MAG: hypothetical protein IPO87_11865 [Flavobacteriales bacterium]|nr:hypothetical protein [Flavobacteriales bacterium]